MKSKHLIILITIIFSICLSSSLFAGSFADTFGMSAQGMARGNAMTAVVNDWSSVYYNVAGLGKTQIAGPPAAKEGEMTLKLRKAEGEGEKPKKEIYPNEFSISVLTVIPQLTLDIQRYGYNSSSGTYYPMDTKAAKMDPYGFVVIGGALDLNNIIKMPDVISSARLGIGMGMNWDLSLVKVNDIDPRTHDFLRYGREIQRATILIGAAMGFLNDAFGGGIGINAAFGGKGKLFMETTLTGQPQIPVAQTTMDLSISPGAIAGIYLSPGKFFKVIDGLEIGASYRQETMLNIDPFDAGASLLGGGVYMQLMLAIFDYYTPHTVNTGIAYTTHGVTLSFDIDYEMWSMSQFGKVMEYHFPILPKFVDTLSYKFGINYDTPVSWLSIMFGYAYVPSILDKSTDTMGAIRISPSSTNYVQGLYNLLDNDKHIASLGLKFTVPKMGILNGQVIIGIAYQFQYLVPQSVNKTGYSYDMTTNTQEDITRTYLMNPSYNYGGMNHSIMVDIGMRI